MQAAAAAVDEGPTGWEELEAPQDVQQQAGEHMQAVSRGCSSAWVLPQRPGAPLPQAPLTCMLLPPPPLPSDHHPPPGFALAEPVQREERHKLSKHAKKRAKGDRERQIHEAELRRLQVRCRWLARAAREPRGLRFTRLREAACRAERCTACCAACCYRAGNLAA